MIRREIDPLLISDLEEDTRIIERKALSDPEIIAGEILHDRRLIPIMIRLKQKPVSPRELLDVRIPVKKEVEEKDVYDRVTKKIVTEWVPIPKPTIYRLIKRLEAAGVIRQCQGLDRRKKYYKLTDLGISTIRELRRLLLEIVLRYSLPIGNLLKEGDSDFRETIMRNIGREEIDPRSQVIDNSTLSKIAERLYIRDYMDLVSFLELKRIYSKKHYNGKTEYYLVKIVHGY